MGRWSFYRIRLAIVGLVIAAFCGAASAQATWVVQTLIPEVIAVRTPTVDIGFDLAGPNYPPVTFPAIFPATSPEGGVFPVQVYSNASGVWSLLLEVPEMRDDAAGASIPASQLLYRINGGLWLRADGTPQVIYTQDGPTVGWFELKIEFAIELVGNERAGSYGIQAIVTAFRQP
jgi:hypothetical protein